MCIRLFCCTYGISKTFKHKWTILARVGSHCLLLRKDFTFCFNISTGVWWAFSFLFLSRIFLLSWPGEGSMGSSEKSLSNKNFVTNLSPNTFWNTKNRWCVMENPKARAWNESAQLMATLKISAILRCWGSEQWFSMEMMTGMSEVMKALRSMASTTSCERQSLWKDMGVFCSFQVTYCWLRGELPAFLCKEEEATWC